ncbi:DNA-binding IclR family transcriptional regulator [Litorivivens lipolytica]|uniref:DNA-binding IclR family transcriptional regulator n=1 Tax=Litorivivens lipolytica TaxID=1524264 RepID=A0A7W4W3J8_9GAMM|nr:helix-turn-helix domain-containing protein [Litorivivens lipolytica]MBB3046498.1 DNA-binding IclR family transcriptional regulator [Litorivivens lipolytica]
MALFSKPTARALAILDLLTANPQDAFGLTDITRKLGLNKATCHAILTTMAHYGFLVQDPRSKAYRLGPNIVAAGNAAFALFPVLEYARPELESLAQRLNMGCGAAGRSGRNLVLLAHYGHSNPAQSPYQLGMRLPFMAPLGASFIAWSPARQLEQWLQTGEQQLGEALDDKLDQQLRISVIAIRARGFEVTLKTEAEETLFDDLTQLRGTWDIETLEQVTSKYQKALLQSHYHLDRIDPGSRYPVCNITVPVFGYDQLPELMFSTGSINRDLSGKEILEIAEQLKAAAERARLAAARAYNRTQT